MALLRPHRQATKHAAFYKAAAGRRRKRTGTRALQIEVLERREVLQGAPVSETSNFVAVQDIGDGLFWHFGNNDNDPDVEFQSRFGFADSSPYTDEAHRILYGDMSGDGVDRAVAVEKIGAGLQWFVQDDEDTDVEYRFQFGLRDDVVLIGDFNANGWDDVAVARPGRFDPNVGLHVYQWYVAHDPFRGKESGGDGGLLPVNEMFEYGYAGDTLLVGDWNGDGRSQPGLVSQKTTVLGSQVLLNWYLDGISFPFGFPGKKPVVGDWDGDGLDNVGVVEEYPGQPYPDYLSLWLLDLNRDAHAEIQFRFGLPDDQYFSGQLDQPEITVDDVSITEGDSGTSNLVFTVRLSHPSQVPVTVDFGTSDYSAREGSDYSPVSGRLTFQPPSWGNAGETSKSISVPIGGDGVVEAAESFQLRLSNPVGGRLTDDLGMGTIRDNDSTLLSISDAERNEGASGETEFQFYVISSKPVDTDVEVRLRTRDATAAGGSDYVPVDRTIVVPAGQLSTSSSVSVTGDVTVELNENFTVELSGIQVAGRDVRLGEAIGTGTILNDDSANLQVQVSNESAPESVGQMPFAIRLSNPVDVETRVLVSTANGSASTADGDYQPIQQELTFPANVTERTIRVTVNNDDQVELPETYFVNISNIQTHERAVSLGSGGQGVIENDDFAIVEIISDVQRLEGNSGTTPFTFGVRLSNPVDAPVDVRFTTAGGTGAEGYDFQRVNDVITFPRGTWGIHNISVNVIGDVEHENDEHFFVNLGDLHVHARDVRMGADERRAIIADDDAVGSISGTKFDDSNSNGRRDQNEAGLPNWTIFVDENGDGVLNSNVQAHVGSADVPVPIPDRATSRSQLAVAGMAGLIGDVDLSLDIAHTYVGDLTATLISPFGTRLLLFSRVGGNGMNFTGTVFDDAADTQISAASAPFTGRFRPAAPLTSLAGEDPNGIWTLVISDDMARDGGTLNSWSLDISTAVCDANASERCAITGSNGAYVFRDLPAGSYKLLEVQQPGWRQTFPVVENRLPRAYGSAVGVGDDTTQVRGLFLPPQRRFVGGQKPLSGASKLDALDAALEFLRSRGADLGLSESDLDSFMVTDRYVSEHTGVTHLYLRQLYNGLEILNADINVNVSSAGEVLSAGSTFLSPGSLKADLVRLGPVIAAESGLPELEQYFGEPLHAMAGAFPPELHYVPTSGGIELAWRLNAQSTDLAHWYDTSVSAIDGEVLYWTDWASSLAEYNVFPIPVEHPEDGRRVLQVSPYAPDASPFGWHDTNGVEGSEFTDTRGNNVFAQEDVDANDRGGLRPDGGGSLTFDFSLDLNQQPASYLPAAITNLFYWNNVLHDIHYQYGFDEAAGNFQMMNYSGLGAGGDPIMADAQDGSGVDNANFSAPPDGYQPRMQMYRWTSTSPERDSDFDNQVVIHEYGHGISTRLTGGPGNSGALRAVQSGSMGEGWSDWWALILTSKPEDFSNPSNRFPIGAYLLGQDPEEGTGIRSHPYSFDMQINPLTLGRFNLDQEVHTAGEIWASVLWDLTWLLVNGDGGNIPPKGFDADVYRGNGGNNLAMQLVMDGLKLQPANPSFLDARDAILLADQIANEGANQLAIWTAFARRGFGASASDGGSAASITVSQAFDLPMGGHLIQLQVGQSVNAADFGNRREPARISIANAVTSVEGAQAIVVVALGNPAEETVRVNYRTVANSAVASNDFEPISGTLLFKPGEIRKTVLVPVHADVITEPVEVLNLSLSDAENGVIVDGLSTISISDSGTIVNDDAFTARNDTYGTAPLILEDAAVVPLNIVANDSADTSTGGVGSPVFVSGQTFQPTDLAGNPIAPGTLAVNDGDNRIDYTPASDYNGTFQFAYQVMSRASGVQTATATVTVTVTAVNDAPTFTRGADVTVLEDSGPHTISPWATNMSPGPANESGRLLDFLVTNDNNALFAAQPVLSPTGVLTFTPALHAWGQATVTVRLHDSGGTSNAGSDASAPQTFTVSVTPLREPLSVSIEPAKLLESSLEPAIVRVTRNDPDGPLPKLEVTFSSSDASEATIQRVVWMNAGSRSAGVYLYPVDDSLSDGSQRVTVKVSAAGYADGFGTIDILDDESTSDVPPSFTKGPDVTVFEGAGAQTRVAWATNMSPGPANESGQLVDFLVSNDNTQLFAVQPAISPAGTLTFTPAANASGQATVTVRLHDNGGTSNGGSDTSAPQTFTITVMNTNTAPQLAAIGAQTVAEQTALMLTATATDADLPANALTFSLVGAPGGATIDAATGAFRWTPTETQGPGRFTFTVKVTDNGTPQLSDEEQVTVIVTETNTAPVLAAIGNRMVTAETTLTFTAVATDSDLPANTLVYSLEGAPNGATIDATTGVFRWTPTSTQGPGLFTFTVKATDHGTPSLSDDELITVTVTETAPVVQLPAGLGINQVAVRRQGENVQVVDAGNRVLWEAAAGAFQRLTILGAANRSDTVTVDLSNGALVIPGGIVFDGGKGRKADALVLRGTSNADLFSVTQDSVTVNGLVVTHRLVEQRTLDGAAGDDRYALLSLGPSSGGVPLVLTDAAGLDTLDFSAATARVSLDLSKSAGQFQAASARAAKLALRGLFEDVVGTAFADTIRGNSAANRLWGGAGNDTLYGGVGDDVLYGGDGKDRLYGDFGNDLLLGEAGNDQLNDSGGWNLLLGGLGADSLKGGTGQDILIGGTTSHDANEVALRALLAEWSTPSALAVRCDRLKTGSGLNRPYALQAGVTVVDDGAVDSLLGGKGSDWFLPFQADKLSDVRGEDSR